MGPTGRRVSTSTCTPPSISRRRAGPSSATSDVGLTLGRPRCPADTVTAIHPADAPHPDNVFTRMFPDLPPFFPEDRRSAQGGTTARRARRTARCARRPGRSCAIDHQSGPGQLRQSCNDDGHDFSWLVPRPRHHVRQEVGAECHCRTAPDHQFPDCCLRPRFRLWRRAARFDPALPDHQWPRQIHRAAHSRCGNHISPQRTPALTCRAILATTPSSPNRATTRTP